MNECLANEKWREREERGRRGEEERDRGERKIVAKGLWSVAKEETQKAEKKVDGEGERGE